MMPVRFASLRQRCSLSCVLAMIWTILAITFCQAGDNESSDGKNPSEESTPLSIQLLILRGSANYAQRRPQEAIDDLSAAVQSVPDAPGLYFLLGLSHEDNGEYAKAINDFSKAIELDDTGAWAYVYRGRVARKAQKYDMALKDFDLAISKSPMLACAYSEKAFLLASCVDEATRNGPQAVNCAKQACEFTNWKSPLSIEALAAAYAECGDWKSAVETQERAFILLTADDDRVMPNMRRNLYEKHCPFRETFEVVENTRRYNLRCPVRVELGKPKQQQ